MTAGRDALRGDWRVPRPGRLRGSELERQAVLERHEAALEARQSTYLDPLSGLSVFTAAFLAGRGYCCESGCRHCPYTAGDDDG